MCLVGWQATTGVTLDNDSLKSTLLGLGYTPKDLGDGFFEITISDSDLDIPTRVFLAKSRLKVWLSVTVMLKDGVEKLGRDELQKFLEKNVDIGPAHFMIESGALKIKLPFDNRSLSPALVKAELEYIQKRVLETRSMWQK